MIDKLVATPESLSPMVDMAVQSAAMLVPDGQRERFVADLDSLITAIMEGRDTDAAEVVERYQLGANFGMVILHYRERARGRH